MTPKQWNACVVSTSKLIQRVCETKVSGCVRACVRACVHECVANEEILFRPLHVCLVA